MGCVATRGVWRATWALSGWAVVMATLVVIVSARQVAAAEPTVTPQPVVALVNSYCIDCHDATKPAGEFDLQQLIAKPITDHAAVWERVVRKLVARQMPPLDAPRPDEPTYAQSIESLTGELDAWAQSHPHPGRTESLRRLTRTEYQHAIRDLLAIDVDAKSLLPEDQSSQGFDNITVGELSPTQLNRYLSAAQKIARAAVGVPERSPAGDTYRVAADLTQDFHLEGLPLGTRGGTLIRRHFPRDGEYEIRVRLARDRNEEVEGLRRPHQLEIMLDRQRLALLDVRPPDGPDHSQVDAELHVRSEVTAGPHELGVTFLDQGGSLLETLRQPYQAHFNMHRHPRQGPAVYEVTITGPMDDAGPGSTPSRIRLLLTETSGNKDIERILSGIARRAWRRSAEPDELARLKDAFERGARGEAGVIGVGDQPGSDPVGSLDRGLEAALAQILVSPQFLFRIDRDPPGTESGQPYKIADLELASRLSFFLWSSIPDDELLDVAERGQLSDPEVLDAQLRRMLADDCSQALVTNFVDQWLYLRNLDSVHPDMRLFPDFDDNLRQAMRTETEMFVSDVIRSDRSVLNMLSADYTFLNERLARHYGIPHVIGSRFRRVELGDDRRRGGLLRQGSILTVTSYATRTSPVIRGHWILKNLLGSPPPPPPPNVPALDNSVAADLPVRERLAQHRADPACASCHNIMDPVGMALEHYDAVGRWRDLEADQLVDDTGGLPDGTRVSGVDGLERALSAHPDWFVGTLTEKLLTYALGRGLDERDAPAVRQIVREAKESDYRFSAIVAGIVHSVPFQMRTAE
ncbi:MAG: DUF1592 domain-containing protein [Pirellulales bacterium]